MISDEFMQHQHKYAVYHEPLKNNCSHHLPMYKHTHTHTHTQLDRTRWTIQGCSLLSPALTQSCSYKYDFTLPRMWTVHDDDLLFLNLHLLLVYLSKSFCRSVNFSSETTTISSKIVSGSATN